MTGCFFYVILLLALSVSAAILIRLFAISVAPPQSFALVVVLACSIVPCCPVAWLPYMVWRAAHRTHSTAAQVKKHDQKSN